MRRTEMVLVIRTLLDEEEIGDTGPEGTFAAALGRLVAVVDMNERDRASRPA